MKNYKNLGGILSILGAVLGAGFISGAEINSFFIRFGYFGILGAILSGILFGFIIYFTAKKMSKKYAKMQNITKKLNFLPFCQVFISGAMVSGIVKVLSGYGIPIFISYLIIFAILLSCLIVGISSANIVNIVVSVSLVVLLPFIIFNLNNFSFNFNLSFNFSSLIPCVLFACFYVAMNTAASMPIISHAVSGKISSIKFSIITSVILTVLTLTVFAIIAGAGINSAMPMLSAINNLPLKIIYSVLFVTAMISTMLSSSMGAKKVFLKTENNFLISLCTTFAIFSVSFVGFDKLINYVYPIIGVLLIVQLVVNKFRENRLKVVRASELY